MLCGCLESPFDSSSQNLANGSALTSSYPGQRRFVKTGGNALAAYDPSKHGDGNQHGCVGSGGGSRNENTRVSVTVPAGVSPGQTIQVASPDGRMVTASVPPGMNPGSTFIVDVPPVHVKQPQAVAPEGGDPSVAIPADNAQAAPNNSYQNVQVLPPPQSSQQQSPVPVASPVPLPVPVPPPQSVQQQKMVMVKVPPGTAPGTTLHVQIPGENRMIAAQVPPGVSEFRVAYEPSPGSAVGAAPLPVPIPPPVLPGPTSAPAPSSQQQKMILVKVPPGTAPGTTLHVQIPGDNRMIAAQVPPGVSEFHVACPPPQGARKQQQQHHQQQQQSGGKSGWNSTNGNGNNRFGNMGSMIPMVAGGALMGAAGMAMYDHAAHASNNNAYADNSDTYPQNENGYGDNGMGDFDDGGGGFDGGDFGGDF